jgi:hypothetical protein
MLIANGAAYRSLALQDPAILHVRKSKSNEKKKEKPNYRSRLAMYIYNKKKKSIATLKKGRTYKE